jgi:signal transduction histidine kinase
VLLRRYSAANVTVSSATSQVLMPADRAREVAAAVGAALDNIRRHAGDGARAWILVEAGDDVVTVTVRDDGVGMPDGRLRRAAAEGRIGVAESIVGRITDLGGTADIVSVPGQGVEIELSVPVNSASRPARLGSRP